MKITADSDVYLPNAQKERKMKRVAIITSSDTGYQREREDLSGPANPGDRGKGRLSGGTPWRSSQMTGLCLQERMAGDCR